MKLQYDAEADAAYLYLAGEGGEAVTTVLGQDEAEGVNLDFAADGKLLGVEILAASTRLPKDLLK